MAFLPPTPRKLQPRFVVSQLGGAAVLVLVGALFLSAPFVAAFDGLLGPELLFAFGGLVLLRVAVLRVLYVRMARIGEEAVVEGRVAIRFRKRLLILRADGYPLALTPDESRRLAMHKLVSDIHTC